MRANKEQPNSTHLDSISEPNGPRIKPANNENRASRSKYKGLPIIRQIILVMIPALIAILYTGIFFQISIVKSDSMKPLFQKGTVIIANRFAYTTRIPKRGDVITFTYEGEKMSKRIVGLPGETISFTDGYVYIDGKLLEETYIDKNTETNSIKSFHIPDNSYFVMGDNRENSKDSRYWEHAFIPKDKIEGRVYFSCYFPNLVFALHPQMHETIHPH